MIDSSPVNEKYSEHLRGFLRNMPGYAFEGEVRDRDMYLMAWRTIEKPLMPLLLGYRRLAAEEELVGKEWSFGPGHSLNLDVIYFDQTFKRPTHKLHFEDVAGQKSVSDFVLTKQSIYYYWSVPDFVFPHPRYKDASFEVLEQIEEVWNSSEDGETTSPEKVKVFRVIPKKFVKPDIPETHIIVGQGEFLPIRPGLADAPYLEGSKTWKESSRSYFFNRFWGATYSSNEDNLMIKKAPPNYVRGENHLLDQMPENIGKPNYLIISSPKK